MSTNPTYIFFTSSAESLDDYTLDLDLDDEPTDERDFALLGLSCDLRDEGYAQ